jgi:hypothetical protein
MLRSMTTQDPAAFFREMLGEWEKMANSVGGQMLKSDQWSQTMHGANAATMNAQTALKQVMERGLAAAHMPSRGEIEDLSARIGRIEASLLRIEALLTGDNPVAGPAKPKPTRGRQPPPAIPPTEPTAR